MESASELKKQALKSSVYTVILAILWIVYSLGNEPVSEVLTALPFFLLFYFLILAAGSPAFVLFQRKLIGTDVRKAFLFPAALLFFYFLFVLLNGENPFKNTLALFPFLIFFPVLAFSGFREPEQKIGWYDFTVFIIFLLPTTLVSFKPSGEMPFHGDGFDSLFRITIILTAVFAFSVIRKIDDVGFFPELKLGSLWTAIVVWLAFYLFVFAIGYPVNFIRITGHSETGMVLFRSIFFTILTTFLHTALFEELFFRGILQNMLAKRIGQSKQWKLFWMWGLAILLPLALLVGYTLKGGMQWFPALITALIFLSAFLIEKSGKQHVGVYTSMAVTSVLFGLVHYHSGAIVYIGFACVAGWAYGFTYLKTKSVFYSALVHALVNSSVLIFGLELVR